MFPKLSRSGLHRLLQYYGISKKPKELQEKPTRSKFKSYEIGCLHIDITDFWLDKKRWSLFVSIDRETKFVYCEIFANKTMEHATTFLENVYKFYPYKIHTILTDNGLQFTYKSLGNKQKTTKIHQFDTICSQNNTEHRLTKFAHPWTNGQVEKMNHIIKSATLKLFHYENIDEYSEHLAKFLNYYNYEKKLKSLKFKSPYDKILDKYKEKPNLFLDNPSYYCMGLNI
jgi:transposase InsO family protein